MSTITKAPSYSEGLKELQNNLATMLPDEALAVFDTDAKQLQQTHTSILQKKVGDQAPLFSLSNAVDETISLQSLLKKGKVVLTFYRGNWCPYCNLQLNQYQQVLHEIKALGANLVAISPQSADASLSTKEKNALKFEVLSDNGNIVARQFTTVFTNAESSVSAMAALGIDFNSFYTDDSQELPVPAVFIIEQDGTISFAKAIDGDYRNRVEASTILSALQEKNTVK
ncbi:peroxiredoxin-like family protein [Aquimarina brevivitae]|uniref:thioredoxin-dependent peroxiredoxin n=1 Tax=Aquimarina brevivitae TaxID=323412 RepID=A0A4V2F5M8_9FLAO|nr:peroxiredoxin-like family protein [Aquimarina brevivitae]RZS93369.1 peroxiredoxin [Aquimarina brevivitae]